MSGTLIGYARYSTDEQDLTAQRDRLHELGVADERVYLDHGLTGTTRARPGRVCPANGSGPHSVVTVRVSSGRMRRVAPSSRRGRLPGDDEQIEIAEPLQPAVHCRSVTLRAMSYTVTRAVWIEWDDAAAQHIRTRSTRYAEAVDVDPAWTSEVVALRDRNDLLRGASAWKTRGAALRQYREGRDDD